jgi:hypothetical protein
MNSVHKLIDGLECESILSVRDSHGDIPLWFLIRNSVLRAYIGRDIYQSSQSFYGRPANRKLNIFEGLIHFVRTFCKFFSKRKPHILVFPSESGFYSEKNGVLKNRYVDEFIRSDPSIRYIVLGSTLGVGKGALVGLPSEYISITLLDSFVKIWGHIFRAFYMGIARSFIELVNSQHCTLFGNSLTGVELNALAKQLAARLASLHVEATYYKYLFSLFKPVAVLYEEGHYQHRVVLTQVARRMGVSTIEYQHGIIHYSHDAYNFSNIVKTGVAYASLLPHFLLTYGPYWHRFCATPSTLISIGNPYRESRISKYKTHKRLKSKTINILVIGDGIETDCHMKLASDVAKAMGIFGKVKFRPHPLERNSVEALISTYMYDFEVDQNQDLYSSLMEADAVVCEVSTVLFEATGIVENVISIPGRKTGSYYSDIPFESVSCLTDLATRLINGGHQAVRIGVDEFWATDWREKYHIFIRDMLKISAQEP